MATGTEAYWLDQAAMAEEYALARPASDLKGFFEALRDRETFLAKAAAAKFVSDLSAIEEAIR